MFEVQACFPVMIISTDIEGQYFRAPRDINVRWLGHFAPTIFPEKEGISKQMIISSWSVISADLRNLEWHYIIHNENFRITAHVVTTNHLTFIPLWDDVGSKPFRGRAAGSLLGQFRQLIWPYTAAHLYVPVVIFHDGLRGSYKSYRYFLVLLTFSIGLILTNLNSFKAQECAIILFR